MANETIESQITESHNKNFRIDSMPSCSAASPKSRQLLMLAQDLPSLPSTFVVQLDLHGRIDHGSFEAAIAEALDRHPLLRAFIQPGKGGLPCWTAAKVQLPSLDWGRRLRANKLPSRRSHRPLRIMMPTDLRESEDCEMPAANLTSYAFLNRNAHSWGSPEELLKSIRNETELFKSRRSGMKFMHIIDRASRVNWLLPFILTRNICLATAVLSNAADPSRRFTAKFPRESGRIVCGNLVLEAITGVPPLRLKTRASFSISQYNRQLTVSLRCDPHYFRLDDTAMLIDIVPKTHPGLKL